MLINVNISIGEKKIDIKVSFSSPPPFHFPEYFVKLPEFELVAFGFRFATEHKSFSGLCFSCQDKYDVCASLKKKTPLVAALYSVVL